MTIGKQISVILTVLAVLILVAAFFNPHRSNTPAFTTPLRIGSTDMHVALATTSAEEELGLSHSAPLTPDRGMLFVFPAPQTPQFWMKDMNYPLDIIWIDASKRVVDISKNILPESYPKTVQPKTPILYVLEVSAGFSDTHALAAGTEVSF